MPKLTREEKDFLGLDESQLAIRLHEKGEDLLKKKTLLQRLFGISIRQLIALSAFVAAIIPLYELNKSAIDYTLKRRELARILDTAERLVAVEAMGAAEIELAKAQKIDDSNTKLLHLQSLIDLEEALRTKQDIASLRELEVRYGSSLREFPKSSYLMGTAYINWDLEKADGFLDNAEKINGDTGKSLEIRILSGRIWILSRRFQKNEDPSVLKAAGLKFEEAMRIVRNNPKQDFSKDLIPLYHNYSFIAAEREKLGHDNPWHDSITLSEMSFSSAMRTGSHLLISKSAKALAEKRKDSGPEGLPSAKILMEFAIRHAGEAQDERGLYYGQYTLGQIEYLMGNYEESKTAYLAALGGAFSATDYRIEIFSRTALAKNFILLGEFGMSDSHLQTARLLAKETGDEYGVWETEIISLLCEIVENTQLDIHDLAASFSNLKSSIPQNLNLHHAACKRWIQILQTPYGNSVLPNFEVFNFDRILERHAFTLMQARYRSGLETAP